MDGVTSLNELRTHKRLKIYWIPGREGQPCNEKVVCLTNKEARLGVIGPEVFLEIPTGSLNLGKGTQDLTNQEICNAYRK